LRDTLNKLLRDGIPAELVKLQDAGRTPSRIRKNSIAGLASIWSEAVACYNLRSPDEDIERIRKVTVDEVNAVARKYLDLDHAVSAALVPQSGGRPVASASFGGQETIALGEAQPTPLPDWAATDLTA